MQNIETPFVRESWMHFLASHCEKFILLFVHVTQSFTNAVVGYFLT